MKLAPPAFSLRQLQYAVAVADLLSFRKAAELEFRATSLPTLAQMVADGAGVTLLPQLSVPTEVKRAEISVRPFAEPSPGRTVALIWRKRSPLAGALRQIAKTARDASTGPGQALRARSPTIKKRRLRR